MMLEPNKCNSIWYTDKLKKKRFLWLKVWCKGPQMMMLYKEKKTDFCEFGCIFQLMLEIDSWYCNLPVVVS